MSAHFECTRHLLLGKLSCLQLGQALRGAPWSRHRISAGWGSAACRGSLPRQAAPPELLQEHPARCCSSARGVQPHCSAQPRLPSGAPGACPESLPALPFPLGGEADSKMHVAAESRAPQHGACGRSKGPNLLRRGRRHRSAGRVNQAIRSSAATGPK